MSLRVHPKSGCRLSPSPEWQHFLDENAEGNHLIAWTSTDAFRRELTDRFLGRGLDRNELVFVLLPLDELTDLRPFTWRRAGLESLVASRRMRVHASEEVEGLGAPREAPPDAVRRLLGSWIREAVEGGYSGARILGRVAPLFFERIEDGIAAEIEEQVRPFRGHCTVLCLYRTAALDDPAHGVGALRVSRAHTHSILELPDGGVVCAPGPSDVPEGGRG